MQSQTCLIAILFGTPSPLGCENRLLSLKIRQPCKLNCDSENSDLSVKFGGVKLPLLCAGSEGMSIFELDGDRVRAIPGCWQGTRYRVEPVDALEV